VATPTATAPRANLWRARKLRKTAASIRPYLVGPARPDALPRPPMSRRVGMGVIFYPRGGSAQVIRYLAAALQRRDWVVELLSGSLGEAGERTHAETFYRGLEVTPADYRAAVAAHARGSDPMAEPVPMHPSYEHREGAADRLFAAVSPELGEHLARAWEPLVERAFAANPPELLHLHHLTPLHEAAERRLPGLPLVTHLHGTELKMIERALEVEIGPEWEHAAHWAGEMRRWAARSDRLLVISPHDRDDAERLLGADPAKVTWVPNGVDLERFEPRQLSMQERLARWRRWLVEEPRGWCEGGEPGAVGYSEEHLRAFVDSDTGGPAPVLLFVGRFTEVKRIPLLVRAYARARERLARRAPLVVWGGFPGEWEGEHPHTVAEREGVPDVFFVGWRGHTELPEGLACSEVMVLPSIKESFGQVLVEAMACGVPVIAANAGGPPSFVNIEPSKPNGWLVEPDDLDGLADALVEAVNDPVARAERARDALEAVRRDFSWEGLAGRVATVYEEAIGARRGG
jgi:glycosyltransferase involved in cell wall biosynthesis